MNKVSPFSTGLKYGIILALISILITVILYVTGMLTNSMASSILGLLGLVASIAVIVLAIKSHRDVSQNGYITLGQAFGVGIITSLVSSVIGAIFTYILYKFIDPGLIEELWTMTEEGMIDDGMSEDSIDAAMEMSKSFMSAEFLSLVSLGGVCCGAVVSLIAGLILKNEPLQDNTL